MRNAGFLNLFLSTGMFVCISLLSDSWLWRMSWEGVPFLILSLESSQTRFVPVSTSSPSSQISHTISITQRSSKSEQGLRSLSNILFLCQWCYREDFLVFQDHPYKNTTHFMEGQKTRNASNLQSIKAAQ